jgi:hypothetical protein
MSSVKTGAMPQKKRNVRVLAEPAQLAAELARLADERRRPAWADS